MKILGIDTATKFLCLGIYDDGKFYEYNLETGRQLSSLLGVTIKRVLDTLGLGINDINYFACGLGPGSFTGMRVGLATAKGMSWAANKPLIGITTLDILAQNAPHGGQPVTCAMDAKRNLIYCATYKDKNSLFKRITPYALLSPEELIGRAKPHTIILGDAISLYKEKFTLNLKGATILDKDSWYPKARHIIRLALERISRRKFDSPFTIKPVYLYPKECQIKKIYE